MNDHPHPNLDTEIGILRDQLLGNDHLFGQDRLQRDLHLHLDHLQGQVVAETLPHPLHHLPCLPTALLCQCLPTTDQTMLQLSLLLAHVPSSHHLEVGMLAEVAEDPLAMTVRLARTRLVGEQHQVVQAMSFQLDQQELLTLSVVHRPSLHQFPLVHHLPFLPVLQVAFLPDHEPVLGSRLDHLSNMPPACMVVALNPPQPLLVHAHIQQWQTCLKLFQLVGSIQQRLACPRRFQ